MASLLEWGKKKASQLYDQVNPLDSGRSWQTRTPAPQQAQRGIFQQAGSQVANTGSRVFDQLNVADSGRSFGNRVVNPNVPQPSAFQQVQTAVRNTPGIARGIGQGIVTPFTRIPDRIATGLPGGRNLQEATTNYADSTANVFKATLDAYKQGRIGPEKVESAYTDWQNALGAMNKESKNVASNTSLRTGAADATNVALTALTGAKGLQAGLGKGSQLSTPTLTSKLGVGQKLLFSPQAGLRGAAGTGLKQGAISGAVNELYKENPTLKGALEGAAPGAILGAGIGSGAYGIGKAVSGAPQANLKLQQKNPAVAELDLNYGQLKQRLSSTPASAKKNIQEAMAINRAERQRVLEGGFIGPGLKTPSVPKVTEGLQPASPFTKTPKSPNAFARSWQTVRGVISQYGEGGKEFANRLGKQRDLSEVGQQAFIDKIPTVSKLGKDDFAVFVQSLEDLSKGKKVTPTPQVAQAITEWNKAIPEIRQRAVQAGLDVGDLGPNYFPRQYKDLLKSDQAMSRMAQQMVDSGKAKDLADAMGKLQFMKTEYQRPFGNLERTREFDMPGYDMTPEALTNYISRSFDRITKAEQFGAKNEGINQLRAQMQQEGFNATPGSTADKYIKIALGDVDKSTTGHKISGGIRKFNALRSLSTAGIANASQSVNTATIAGIGRTLKGITKAAVSPKARAEARQTGVTLEASIKNLSEQGVGTSGKITRNIAAPFFRQIEKFNRQATAIVGKDYGNHLAKRGNTKVLREKFGVTGPIGKTLTRDQQIQVSRKLVELSQFKVDPQDLPGWVDSPMGKLVAQFRTFGYKQTDFMYNQVLREAVKGNFLPIGRFIALATPLGAASLAARGKIKGTNYTEEGEGNTSKGLKAIAAVGGFGLPGSEAQNLYKSAQYGNLEGALAGTVGGPTASLLTETAGNVNKAIGGNSRPLIKQTVRNVPTIGPSIANRVFPKQTSSVPQAPKVGEAPTSEFLNKQSSDEKKQIEAKTKPGDYSLRQLPNGKYLAEIDGDVREFSDLEDARMASRKDKFKKSDAKSKVFGDTYFYKTKDGDVKTKPKVLYDFEQVEADLGLKMDRAYRAEDLGAWQNLAAQKYDALEQKKSLYDPQTEQDEITKLTNQQEDLIYKLQGYLEKGGIGSGGGKGKAFSGGGFKTAGVSAPSKPKGITVRAPSLRSSGTSLKKLSVNKIKSSASTRRLA